MIDWTAFARLAHAVTEVTLDPAVAGCPDRHDPNQSAVIAAPLKESQFVLAGPGTGKTTSATLRLLKLAFVDDVPPEAMLATTFTRRAAAVLRSRIVSWGEGIREHLRSDRPDLEDRLDRLDINALRVGTIDSLAQDILNDHKQAGDPRPSPVDPHVLTSLMLSEAVFGSPVATDGASSEDVAAFLRPLYPGDLGSDPGRANALNEIRQRLHNDRVNCTALRSLADATTREGRGLLACLAAIERFDAALGERQIYDFTAVNAAFLEALRSPRLAVFRDRLRYVLVDEYQDTNYLQEEIYFELARAAAANGGSISVVGDDDQSLYRFRGATVELFAGYEARLRDRVGVESRRFTLDRNYRSTVPIVKHVNRFVLNDEAFQAARVAGKPPLRHGGANTGRLPIFGIFRDTEEEVARDIARFVAKLRRGLAVCIAAREGPAYEIRLDPERGSAGDVAVLTYSAREFSDRNRSTGATGRQRFPGKLRDALESQMPAVQIFNPRGQPLREVPSVQELLGDVLDCLDPDRAVLDLLQRPRLQERRARLIAAAAVLDEWRAHARVQRSSRSPDLASFIESWGARRPTRRVLRPTRVSLNDLIFKLITWLPEFHDDIEHLAWLEAVQRTVSAAAVMGGFGGDLVFVAGDRAADLARRSVVQAYRRILIPIAEGVVEVSEDMLETLPMDRVSLMTIHQSKGLEFPIAIVDVGTALQKLSWLQPRNRFPTGPDTVHKLEDEFRTASDIGLPSRDGRDRAFDDLIRNYFVAFSRAQDALILAGHRWARERRPRSAGKPACHVATGWTRDGAWPWGGLPNVVEIEEHHL